MTYINDDYISSLEFSLEIQNDIYVVESRETVHDNVYNALLSGTYYLIPNVLQKKNLEMSKEFYATNFHINKKRNVFQLVNKIDLLQLKCFEKYNLDRMFSKRCVMENGFYVNTFGDEYLPPNLFLNGINWVTRKILEEYYAYL